MKLFKKIVMIFCLIVILFCLYNQNKKLNLIANSVIETYDCILYSYKNTYYNINYLQKQIDSINNNYQKIITNQKIIKNDVINQINNQNNERINSYKNYVTINNQLNNLEHKVNIASMKPSYQDLKDVTVKIFSSKEKGENYGSVGTGTIIKITDNYTYILTNRHVATKGTYVGLMDEYNIIYKDAEVLRNSTIVDLSLIKVRGKINGKKAFKGFGEIDYAEKVYSVGMFLGNNYYYTEGTMSGKEASTVIFNTPCGPGCSGSGIFNKEGKLVGVLYAGYQMGTFQVNTSKSICVDIVDVKIFLRGII